MTNWSEEGGGGAPIFDQVDEGITGADSTGIQASATATALFTLSDPPGDLGDGSVTAVTFNLRHKQSGQVDDTLDWGARLLTSAGVTLAAADSGVTFQNVATVSPYRTAYGNNGAVSFAYVNTGATAAQWADARVRITITRSSIKGADSITAFIDAFDISVTYTPTVASVPHLSPMFRLLGH